MKKTVVGLGAGPVLVGDAHHLVAPGLALRRGETGPPEPARAATSPSPPPHHNGRN